MLIVSGTTQYYTMLHGIQYLCVLALINKLSFYRKRLAMVGAGGKNP